MRRLILPFYLILLIITSCEKPVIPGEYSTQGDLDGNLVVSVFQIEQQSFGTSLTRAVIADYCSRLSYAVYDADGKLVKQVNQMESDSGFGTAYFKVDPGTYQVVVVGHSSGNPTMTNSKKIKFENKDGFTDTFLHNSNVVVTDADDEEQVQAVMRRIVSLCRVVFTDAIPDGVSQMRFEYKGGSGAFDAATGLGSVNSTQKETFPVDAGDENCCFDLYTFLHDTEGTIHLQATALDDNDNELREREFDVPLKQRMITKLSGPYFSGTTGSSITIVIGINAEWEGEQTIEF
jgi:hypothetical protein